MGTAGRGWLMDNWLACGRPTSLIGGGDGIGEEEGTGDLRLMHATRVDKVGWWEVMEDGDRRRRFLT